MQGSHTYIPGTNHVPRGYIVASILSLFFMVPLCLVRALALLFFYLSTFRSMCAVPNMAVFCSSLTSWFPGMSLTYFLNDLEMVPVAPIFTGITLVYYYYYYYYYYHHRHYLLTRGPNNVAIRNGLDGSGIQCRWGRVCFVPALTTTEAHPASRAMSAGSLPGVKRPECRADHLPHSTSEVANGRNYTCAYPLCLRRHIMG